MTTINLPFQYVQNGTSEPMYQYVIYPAAVTNATLYPNALSPERLWAITLAAPDAFMPMPEGGYTEVRARVPRRFAQSLTMEQFPEIFLALLRQKFEEQGIQFDTKMGSPPTMKDFEAQLLGFWTFWVDGVGDTYNITQRMPKQAASRSGRDYENEFEAEMTEAMTKLIKALRND